MTARLHALGLLAGPLLLFACSEPSPARLVLDVTPADAPALRRYAELLPFPAELRESADPTKGRAASGALTVAVVSDLDCTECYRVDREEDRFVVRGGGILGAQYGLSALLERHGVGFFHR